MNNTFNITLDDVKAFLSTLGYKWNGTIVNNEEYIVAQNFNDFSKDPNNLTGITLNENGKTFTKNIKITPTSFAFYMQSIDLNDIDSVWEYEVESDYTEQWVRFLLNRYGDDYKSYVKNYCKQIKQIEFNKAKYEFDKIKEIKSEIIRKLKAKLKIIQKLEELINNTDEFKK